MSDSSDDMEFYSGSYEDNAYELEEAYQMAIDALRLIHRIEMNSQRLGSSYSTSAKISYEVLKKLEEL